jgi:hypothetical protein
LAAKLRTFVEPAFASTWQCDSAGTKYVVVRFTNEERYALKQTNGRQLCQLVVKQVPEAKEILTEFCNALNGNNKSLQDVLDEAPAAVP